MTIKLTEYSHGAGCGCKIAPNILDKILQTGFKSLVDPNLLVGNDKKDDAAVYRLNDEISVVSTTDFFMPIVDDPFNFGRIAATNALSDVYAMGATPIMAIAILGWPVKQLSVEIAAKVVDGGRQACKEAGIVLAGGHSIDAPEPIFGLAATGQVPTAFIKKNHTAEVGDRLVLTKPLGVGILTTAQKKKRLSLDDESRVIEAMCQLNSLGAELAAKKSIHAMTDVTGFGLAGHLIEMCEGANVSAQINANKLPLLPGVRDYIEQGCIPGGVERNWQSYGQHIHVEQELIRTIICDPQTSGGLLISVSPDEAERILLMAQERGFIASDIGEVINRQDKRLIVSER
ncbi:selenide, water dikinase SelD [Pleionea sediminis]|uniref:selenide, water dikinase SelD n=1 Tax=Pleionea sediminis TaxID=2569479 RepID=UPI001186FAC4|nr:selenide, water dikinase SelD [Pleionea sediminis]